MSRYRDLGKSWEEGAAKDREHRERAFAFIRTLTNEFQSYLGAPDNAFDFKPMTGEFNPDTSYSRFGALTLGEDANWHFGLLLTLKADEDQFVLKPTGLLHFRFSDNQPKEDSFNVTIGQTGKNFEVKFDLSDVEPLFEFLFGLVKDHYEHGLERFLKKGERERIGFKP